MVTEVCIKKSSPHPNSIIKLSLTNSHHRSKGTRDKKYPCCRCLNTCLQCLHLEGSCTNSGLLTVADCSDRFFFFNKIAKYILYLFDSKEGAVIYQTFVSKTILEHMLVILQIIKVNKNVLAVQAIVNLID